MNIIKNKTFDMERALYESDNVILQDCIFDGPADGESALKESSNIQVDGCYFNLRYPFWHDRDLKISHSEMTQLCRAALWYSENIQIVDTKLHGIKALRECGRIAIDHCDIVSPEFGWSVHDMTMKDSTVQSEYFMMRARQLHFDNIQMTGKYSFQYIEDCVFENCVFDTKDAFWHAKNVVVRNCVVKGEYLAWYCENVTFENCRIIGTQPLCYCKNLKLINCEMEEADLCFEKSEVEATVTTSVISIKNPLSGHIYVQDVGEIICEDARYRGEVILQNQDAQQGIHT